MAIAFNLPSEREATEENYSRLNRLLAELYEVLCHILVARQPGQEVQNDRRDRSQSESDVERPAILQIPPCRRSASSPPLALTFDLDGDDDVFVSPRTDNGSDLFATRNLEIFSYSSPRTPAGIPLSPRRERSFNFAVTSEKGWRDKGGTEVEVQDADVIDAASPAPSSPDKEPSESIFSSIIPRKFSGSICTAVLFMVCWKVFTNKR